MIEYANKLLPEQNPEEFDEIPFPLTVASSQQVNSLRSNSGILEFSPEKAGLDITPANFNFVKSPQNNKAEGSALIGKSY